MCMAFKLSINLPENAQNRVLEPPPQFHHSGDATAQNSMFITCSWLKNGSTIWIQCNGTAGIFLKLSLSDTVNV